jgi:hypothetical protein
VCVYALQCMWTDVCVVSEAHLGILYIRLFCVLGVEFASTTAVAADGTKIHAQLWDTGEYYLHTLLCLGTLTCTGWVDS